MEKHYPELWDEEWLRTRYDEGNTMQEIADEIGTSMMSVYKAFERYSIERRSRSERHTMAMEELYGDEKYRDKEWLDEQYWGKGKSLREVADECGCVEVTIRNWMDKHGIERRTPNGKGGWKRWSKETQETEPVS